VITDKTYYTNKASCGRLIEKFEKIHCVEHFNKFKVNVPPNVELVPGTHGTSFQHVIRGKVFHKKICKTHKYCPDCQAVGNLVKECLKCSKSFIPGCGMKHLCPHCVEANGYGKGVR